MKDINLCNLPDLALNGIAEYLEPKDIINLSDSSPSFEDLRRFLPKYQDINGDKFHKKGPRDGDFEPETYFDGPEMNQGAKSIKMNFKWRDQGHGNQKGQIWVQLIRNGDVLGDTREKYFALAPHKDGRDEYEDREVVIRGHPVVDLLTRGDRLRFMRNVGGGGGHSLTVRQFTVQVELKKY
eukprot:GFUD01032606.1.p1 GENE.GFUD01032606.1~~GFUD01032606.1.p1  ORF type:complete len:182 (+),score=32.11 GFUD01032606.1:136-681(+)